MKTSLICIVMLITCVSAMAFGATLTWTVIQYPCPGGGFEYQGLLKDKNGKVHRMKGINCDGEFYDYEIGYYSGNVVAIATVSPSFVTFSLSAGASIITIYDTGTAEIVLTDNGPFVPGPGNNVDVSSLPSGDYILVVLDALGEPNGYDVFSK